MAVEVASARHRALSGAALRRGPHAHRRRRDRPVAAGAAARRTPARGAMTFGFRRVEILSAQANGVALLILAAFVAYEAVGRLIRSAPRPRRPDADRRAGRRRRSTSPPPARLRGQAPQPERRGQLPAHRSPTSTRFIGTAIAAGVILLTGFERADPIVSLLIAGLMIRSGFSLVKASARVFLEAAPRGLDPRG